MTQDGGEKPVEPSQMETSASLLEDASTLLMFHNTAITSKASETEELNRPTSENVSNTPELLPNATVTASSKSPSPTSSSTQPAPRPQQSLPPRMKGVSSPGPAIAALAHSDNDSSETDKNQKAIVAAAALAAAAGIPLPLIRNGEVPTGVDERLRAVIQEKSRESSEAIMQIAQTEVTKEQLQALQEKAAVMRQVQENIARNEDVLSDATTADMEEDASVERKEEEKREDVKRPTAGKRPSKPKRKGFEHVPEDYVVSGDSGLITCVCGYQHDDGFTIQCDNCNRWVHGRCLGMTQSQSLEDVDFYCTVCQPRRVNLKKAKQIQAHFEKNGEFEVDDHDTAEAEPTRNNEDEGTDTKTQNNKPNKPKPQTTSAYSKNLEDSDIKVPDAKTAYKVMYYELKDYDYQDRAVFDYVNNDLIHSNNSHIIQISKHDFERRSFPQVDAKPYTDVANKKFNGIIKTGLFAESNIAQDAFIHEYLGEIGFKDNYVNDSRNQYRIWGVEKPYVSFIPNTSLVVDARLSGNITRYIRRSCSPNCEIRVVNIDNEEIKFVVVALKPIKSGTELSVRWTWDDRHPIRNITQGHTFDSTSDSDKPSLVLSVESILTFVECSCLQANECALSKVKKASAHIYRSTRKGNSSSGLKLLQKEAKYISIQDRLVSRDKAAIADSSEQVKKIVPLLQTATTVAEAEITVRPFIYTYVRKRTRTQMDEKPESLAIPIEILPEENTVTVTAATSSLPAQPVKKLSFADYKRKKKV